MPLEHHVTLGRSGLRVSPFALGAMTFGEDPPGSGSSVGESEKLLATYLDRGGNFVDTANFYTNGHSERILGDFFAGRPGRRGHVVLASKFFGNMFPGDPNGVVRAAAQSSPSSRRPCAACARTTWTCTTCTTGTVVAGELGTTSGAVSLAWLRARPGPVVPIIGARRLDHLESNLAGLEVTLTADQLRRLAILGRWAGHPPLGAAGRGGK